MLKPGYSFDRYTIEDVLGEGGMGLVYRARDARLDRNVALKIVREQTDEPKQRDDAKARLLREAKAAAALDHPNAVSIFDIGEVDGMPYIAMELVSGRTIREVLSDASISPRERVRILGDVARALSAAHKAGLVHRDIKPENVMVRDDGRVKVLDFGIARRSSGEPGASGSAPPPALATLTAKDVRIGTPTYMAPERIRGEPADGRTDQFSWGVLAYELLTGSLPWKGHDAMSLVASILTEAPAPMPGGYAAIPPGIEPIVQRALAKSPADRYATMEEIVRAIEALLEGRPSAPAPDRLPSASSKPPPQVGAFTTAPTAQFIPPNVTDLRRYSTQELGEIIQRALVRQGESPRFTHEDLVQAAREVGIDEAALRAASREVRAAQKPVVPQATYRLREKQKLLRHVAMYLAFSLFFFLLDRATQGTGWSVFPILAWGIGVAAHAIKYLFPVDPSPRKLADERRRRGQASDSAIEDGADFLLTATERRARVEVPGEASARRVRVEADVGRRDAELEDEAALEAEAQAEAQAEARGKRGRKKQQR